MTRARRVALLAVALTMFTVLSAQATQACSKIACVADTLKKNPVYQDPKAEVQLTGGQQDELRNKISGGNAPIFIAILPKAAADNNGGVDGMPGKIGQAMNVPGVVGVIAGKNFRGTSGGGAPYDRKAIVAAADSAFELNNPGTRGGDVMPMLLDFIGRVQSTPQVQPTTAPSGSSGGAATSVDKDKGPNGWLIFLFILIGIGAVWGAVVIARRMARKARIKTKIDNLGSALYGLENGGSFLNTEAQSNLRQAFSAYRDAEAKWEDGDMDGAEETFRLAQRKYDAAEQMAGEPEPAPAPPPEPVVIPLVKGKRPKKGETKVTSAKIDTEGRVVINNTVQVPQQQRSDANPHYFGGGYYGGHYMMPGYYGMNFWDYLILDSILDNNRDRDHGGSHDSGDREPASVAADSGGGSWDSTPAAPAADTGWGDSKPADTGGGSWDPPARDPEPEPAPRYDPPSYDPPDPPSTDWGGSSGGGGWDSGGGGGGGGGGDSGGGGW